jgi:hypothetical protein
METSQGAFARVPDHIFDTQLKEVVRGAVLQINEEISRQAPFLASEICDWIGSLSPTECPEDCFQDARAFVLLLPWLLEKSIRDEPDLAFQSSVAYSSANAYYYVRLLDNVMDGHSAAEARLLPGLSFFHANVQSSYFPYFPHDSPFWSFFRSTWMSMVDATARDAVAIEFSANTFAEVAAAKIAAVKIPLAAVCFRYQRMDLLEPWCRFCDLLACFHQMQDDLSDWLQDLALGKCTYLLSEAQRRKGVHESVAGWLVREGVAWGYSVLPFWMRQMQALAPALNSVGLAAYLRYRSEEATSLLEDATPDLKQLAKLACLLEPGLV